MVTLRACLMDHLEQKLLILYIYMYVYVCVYTHTHTRIVSFKYNQMHAAESYWKS